VRVLSLPSDDGLFHYRAFGLHLVANGEVPGLTPAPFSPASDVRIWLGCCPPGFRTSPDGVANPLKHGHAPDEASEPWVTVWGYEDYFHLLYKDQTEFFISRLGTEVWATWPAELTLADTATYLLGPIANLVLRLRGTFALHASAVRICDVAVAFVGPQGAGKSTIAASFAVAGFSVLTDDTAAIEDRGDGFKIKPAYPRIRLWPSSVELLFGKGDALPQLTPGWDKCYLQLEDTSYHFEAAPVDLAAIYFLHPRSPDSPLPVIEDEPDKEALIKLIGNIGGNYLLGRVDPAGSFDLLQRIARHVPLRRLVPGSGVASLSNLREAVINDLKSLQARPS
jgi:hypothetical protein